MFTYKDKQGFSYNGRHSDEFNIIHVSLSTGMFEETFVSSRTVNDVYLTGNKESLFSGIEREVLTFEMVLAFKDSFNDILADQVINWLYDVSYYRPLQFDGVERILYAMPDGEATISHTGFEQGYITITMKTNSPFTFGYIKNAKSVSGSSGNTITISGKSNPETKIEVKLETSGTVKIVMNDYTLQINKCVKGETISIYPETEEIESDVDNVYHYSDYIGDLSKLNLKRGTNTISMSMDGDTTSLMTVTYQEYYDK